MGKQIDTPLRAAIRGTRDYLVDADQWGKNGNSKRRLFKYFDVDYHTGNRILKENREATRRDDFTLGDVDIGTDPDSRRLQNDPRLSSDPRGKKRKLTDDDKALIDEFLQAGDQESKRRCSWQSLVDNVGLDKNLSNETIRRRLHELGYHFRAEEYEEAE